MMGIHKITAGSGYTYLTKQVARSDLDKTNGQALADLETAACQLVLEHRAVVSVGEGQAVAGRGLVLGGEEIQSSGARCLVQERLTTRLSDVPTRESGRCRRVALGFGR